MAYSQRYYWGAGPDYQQLINLPTDPAKLRRWIERHAINPGSTCASGVSDCNTFSFVESLLIGGPLPPKLSAALYRVIADLPGMRLIGPTRDPLGRPGVAIGYFFNHQPGRARTDLRSHNRCLPRRARNLAEPQDHARTRRLSDRLDRDRRSRRRAIRPGDSQPYQPRPALTGPRLTSHRSRDKSGSTNLSRRKPRGPTAANENLS